MSIDRSLKVAGALDRHRNVLSRAERINALIEEERWSEGDSLLGLPKVAHRKVRAGKKDKDEADAETTEDGAVVEGAAAAATDAPAES